MQSLFVIPVRISRPEKPLEAVPHPSRHDVNVQVRNALADAVVDRDKAAFRFHASLDRFRNELNARKKRSEKPGREIDDGLEMFLRNEQAVPGKERTAIEKGNGNVIFKYDLCFGVPLNNPAEYALFFYTHQ